MAEASELLSVPETVQQTLKDFVEAAQSAFGDDLGSVVLFGSAAEGRMRATSDVNTLLVLRRFIPAKADQFAPALRLARAAVRLQAMFLLDSELEAAATCFAQKFADINRRRRVLHGVDPFEKLVVPRQAEILRLRQVLLNLTLRLRESYLERAAHDEQVALLVADFAGPLRTCASALLELETGSYHPPKEALDLVVRSFGKPEWERVTSNISAIREKRDIDAVTVAETVFAILEISERMRHRTESLR